MNAASNRQSSRCIPYALLSIILFSAGCNGKVPTWGELTNQQPAQPTTPTQPADAPQAAISPPVAPVEPVKRNPAEVIAVFQQTPPGVWDDTLLGSLLNLEEGLELMTEINAANSKVSDLGLKNLYKLTNLQRLYLPGTTVGDAGCAEIGQVSALEELSMSGGKVSDVGVGHLQNCKNLKRLTVDGTQLSDAGWEIVGNFPALEELWIRQSSISDTGMELLCNASTLRKIVMNDTAITDDGLKALGKLDVLESLNLSGCRVTCEGLGSVVKSNGLRAMKEMIVQRTPLNDKGAIAIGGMKGLERLNIAELHGMQDRHFEKMVKGKKNLRYLNMHSNQGLTNEAIDALKGAEELEFLDISGIPSLNDKCVTALMKMKKLKDFSFKGTSITGAGIAKLQEKIPGLNTASGAGASR